MRIPYRRLLLCALLLLSCISLGHAQEKFTLTTPVSVTDYTLIDLDFNWGVPQIRVTWKSSNGQLHDYVYTETTATKASTLLVQLNKVNLSTAGNSLQARVYKQLLADGIIGAGTVTGLPQ